MVDKIKELARFNALTQADALKILSKAEGKFPDLRSCWYCNSLHEHLKDRIVIMCFACGIYYLNGYPGPVVSKRAEGLTIEDSDMVEFQKILDNTNGD